jgi:hypothetical protein
VVVLAAGRSMSGARLGELSGKLRAAGGEDVEIDLVSWSPLEATTGLRDARVLGPVKVYRPPVPDAETATEAASEGAPHPGAVQQTGGPASVAAPRADVQDSSAPGLAAAARSPRRALGRVYWALRRSLVRARRSTAYKRARSWARGGVPRQFATRALRTDAVLTSARGSRLVVALDDGAVRAAWRIGRRCTGPAVLKGMPAAEQWLRSQRRSTPA